MSGIVGIVDFDVGVTRSIDLIRVMSSSLAHRGPDGQGEWFGEHAAFGHRSLNTMGATDSAQPLVSENSGGKPYVISFGGEIYNFRNLRAELSKKGYTFKSDGDAEVFLKGYECWGVKVAEKLKGVFASAIWDSNKETLILLRDRLGAKPLYYYQKNNKLIFASEMKALFKCPEIKPTVSKTGLCEIFDMVKTPELTVYDEVKELRPGSVVVFNRNGLNKNTYWSLSAKPHTDDLPTTISTIKELIHSSIQEQAYGDTPICSLLSGGLDSSAITAIAAKQIAPKTLPSFSVDFERNVSGFSADGVRGTPDAPFARALAKHAKTNHVELLLSSDQLLDIDVRRKVLSAIDAPPAYWGDMWPSLYLLFQALSDHAKVSLSGEAADEIFGGYQWFRNPAAIAANTFPWLTAGSSRYFGGTQLLAPDLLASLNRDEYRAFRYEEALKEVPVLDGENDSERRMREISYLAMTRFLPNLLDRNDRMSMAVGLQVRFPFCDRELVDYVFNVPWAMKTFDNREKSLLREAASNLLPQEIVNRYKTPYPAIQDGSYEKGLRNQAEEILSDGNSPVIDFLNIERINSLLKKPSTEISQPYNRGSLEMALWMDSWVREYNVNISL